MGEVDHRAGAAVGEPALNARAVVKRVFERVREPLDVFDDEVVLLWLFDANVAWVMIRRAKISAKRRLAPRQRYDTVTGYGGCVGERCSQIQVAVVVRHGGRNNDQAHGGNDSAFFKRGCRA